MNYKFHQLPKLTIEESQAKDTLDCIIHSLLFQRQLGPVFPQEESLMETLAIPLGYTRVGNDDHEVNSRVKKGIGSFCSALQKQKSDQKIGKVFTVTVRFLQPTGQQALEWERWAIPLQIQPRANKAELHQQLLECLRCINRSTDTAIESNYVPLNDGTHHDFQIIHEVGNTTIMETVGNLLSYLTYR